MRHMNLMTGKMVFPYTEMKNASGVSLGYSGCVKYLGASLDVLSIWKSPIECMALELWKQVGAEDGGVIKI